MHFDDRVLWAIHLHIYPEVEEMLVDNGIKARRNERPVLRLRRLADKHTPGAHNPCELDLDLDGSILVEIPEESVVVDSHRSEEGNDQAPRAAHLTRFCAEVG